MRPWGLKLASATAWRAHCWRGARRPGRDHAGTDFRSVGSGRSPAGLPHRFAVASVAVDGRTKGLQIAASGCHRLYRPAEERPADIGIYRGSSQQLGTPRAGSRPPLCIFGRQAAPTQGRSTWLQWRLDFQTSSDVTGVRQWILDQRPPRHHMRIQQGFGPRLRDCAGRRRRARHVDRPRRRGAGEDGSGNP